MKYAILFIFLILSSYLFSQNMREYYQYSGYHGGSRYLDSIVVSILDSTSILQSKESLFYKKNYFYRHSLPFTKADFNTIPKDVRLLYIYTDSILNIDKIAEFRKLQYLSIDFDGYVFPQLPDNICLPDLIYFSASYYISKPDKVTGFIRNQKKLRGLYLATDDDLKVVSDWLTELGSLEQLSIAVEGYSALPKEILELKNLETLEFLSENEIEIDSTILSLSNLEMLNCNIRLTSKNIEVISQMKSIKEVSFNDVNLDTIPDSLIQPLRFLEKVYIQCSGKKNLAKEQEMRLRRLLPETEIEDIYVAPNTFYE